MCGISGHPFCSIVCASFAVYSSAANTLYLDTANAMVTDSSSPCTIYILIKSTRWRTPNICQLIQSTHYKSVINKSSCSRSYGTNITISCMHKIQTGFELILGCSVVFAFGQFRQCGYKLRCILRSSSLVDAYIGGHPQLIQMNISAQSISYM